MPKKKELRSRITERAREAVDTAKDKFDDVREKAEDYVKENPVKSTVIAAAVGAIVATGVTLVLLQPRKKSILDIIKEFI
jgi:ElaB/YqjD/DUF883 family membrane-anchored ribosome-binding protein